MHDIPPERWLHQLNQRYPNLWAGMRKYYNDPQKYLLPVYRDHLRDIPSWCPMPGMFPGIYLAHKYGDDTFAQHRGMAESMQTMYLWRAGKGVYRFAPDLYDALVAQPLKGDLPNEVLFRLPEWAVYIETPGMVYDHTEIYGFIGHLDYNIFTRQPHLQFAIFERGSIEPKMTGFPLGKGGVAEGYERALAEVQKLYGNQIVKKHSKADTYIPIIESMVQLLLYLCSEEPDMPEIEHPDKRRTFSGGVRAPADPQAWNVGIRIGAALKKAAASSVASPTATTVDSLSESPDNPSSDDHGIEQPGRARPRAHIRSAHWTTYWTGPRSGRQTPILRWIPPLPINMNWKDPMPAVVHAVETTSTSLPSS